MKHGLSNCMAENDSTKRCLKVNFGLIPIEIKHTQTVRAAELQALTHFMSESKCAFGLMVNNDERPRLYTERILGMPFACFG